MKTIPSSLQKRIDNVNNRYGIVISREIAIECYNDWIKGNGAKSIGYQHFNVPNDRTSLIVGNVAIDLGIKLAVQSQQK